MLSCRRKPPQCLGCCFSALVWSGLFHVMQSQGWHPQAPAPCHFSWDTESRCWVRAGWSFAVDRPLSFTWLRVADMPLPLYLTWLVSLVFSLNLNVISELPNHPFCPEVPCVFSFLLTSLSFIDAIYIARRQATSMSLDDIIFKFPPVKTKREKWKTLGETVLFNSLGYM